MKLITNGLNDIFIKQIKKAKKVDIAVAYFYPNNIILNYLKEAKGLRLVVSGEFTKNNPYLIEQLKTNAIIRCIKPIHRKLHAKVYIFKYPNKRTICIIGSANLTSSGFEKNRETNILFDSEIPKDNIIIIKIKEWFEQNYRDSKKINFEKEKKVWDNRPKQKRIKIEDDEFDEEINYWILKTTVGNSGESMWDYFLSEGVIAIGWDIKIDINNIPSFDKLVHIFRNRHNYKKREAQVAASTILNFIYINPHDIVVMCRGYNFQQKEDVYLYGIAYVTSPLNPYKKSDWWSIKHYAYIQPIEEFVPKKWLTTSFNRKTLLRTLHYSDKEQYETLKSILRDKKGIMLEF